MARLLTPADLSALLARLGLSQSEAARLLGVHRAQVTRWLAGRPVPGPAARLLRAMDERPRNLRDWLLALD